MNNSKRMIFSSFLAIIVIGGFWPLAAVAQEYSCQIKADSDNIHIYARDFDRDGNPTRRVIFRGWILRGQTIPITSLSGRISVNYKADSAKRGSGSNELTCRGNQTHMLP